MNFRTFISLVVAVSLGLAAVWVGRQLILGQSTLAVTQAPKAMTSVVIAKQDLDPGQVVTSDDLAMLEMPTASLPASYFANPQALKDRALISAVVKGQVMFEALLAPVGSEGGLTALVPKGMRAVSVEVNESSGVSGLLVPGCRVDVIATLRQGEGQIARTIVENAKVQAVGVRFVRGRTDVKEPAAKTVTLIVTSKDAEAIELASNSGRPRLVLRGPSDTEQTASAGVTSAELIGGVVQNAAQPPSPPLAAVEKPRPVPVRPVSRWPVQFIRGNAESTIYYEFWPKGLSVQGLGIQGLGVRLPEEIDPSVITSPSVERAEEKPTLR